MTGDDDETYNPSIEPASPEIPREYFAFARSALARPSTPKTDRPAFRLLRSRTPTLLAQKRARVQDTQSIPARVNGERSSRQKRRLRCAVRRRREEIESNLVFRPDVESRSERIS